MNNQNGQVLTPKFAQELIQELFTGQTVRLHEIIAKVDTAHTERGGQLSSSQHHPVKRALSKMKRIGLANNPKLGLWSIFPRESSESEDFSESGEPDPIESLNEFMNWVEELPRGEYVYRGVSNKDYHIEASTYRRLKDGSDEIKDEDKTAERLLQINREMIEDANRHRHGWENEQRPPDLNLLAKLQHTGAATCLIDFTKNPLVALWMACRTSGRGSVDGKVYAVEISSRSKFIPVSSNDAENKEINHFFKGNQEAGYKLYQWQPHYQDNRMLAQQSVFLFGGGWDAIKPSKKRVISEKHKQAIRDSLKKSAGISEDILFPDFEGFASQRAQNKAYNQPGAQNKAYNQPDALIDKDPVLALPANVTDETIDHEYEELKGSVAALHLDLSLEETREDNIEAAVQHYNEAMELEPSNGLLNYFYRERAIIYHNKGYYESAINDYTEAIRLNSNDEDSYYGRGQVNYGLSRYTESIDDFGIAISINSNNADTHYWLGLAKYNLRQYLEAIDDFDRAINLNPNEAYMYYWRGLACAQLNHSQEAVGYFNQSISRNSMHTYSYYWRGRMKCNMGQYPEAIIDFDRAIGLNPTDADLNGHNYYSRGLAKKQTGLFSAASVDFHMALMCAEETGNDDLMAAINRELSS